ncbi:MAG: ABC transporter ATP-binding protein [Candidatus Hodarchaeales archaeon]|jgi:ABC-2 type transport system ATP-binding protein
MDNAILIENLTKTYVTKRKKGLFKSELIEVQALKGINLEIPRGEFFGLLGPNGAGKTTLIKCLTTLLLPTSGTFRVNGFDGLKESNKVRASIGAMLMGERGLYWKLTGLENLNYFGALYHIKPAVAKLRIKTLIDDLGLQDFADRTVETYSSGQKMKLVFAKSLINDAPVLMLDEPTNTLDVKAARELRKIVKNYNEEDNKTIIFSTHLMSEADELCDRVAIIDHGKIITLDSPHDLKASLEQKDEVLSVEGIFPNGALKGLETIDGVKGVTISDISNGNSGNGVNVKGAVKLSFLVPSSKSRMIIPDVIRVLFDHGSRIEYVSPSSVSLEDVFVSLTGRSLAVDTRQTTKA